MPRLTWSPAALRDAQRLYGFLSEKDAGAARRAVEINRAGVKVIARQPGIGRPSEDMEPEYREWMIDFGATGYVVLYRVDDSTEVILAVRHQRGAGY